MIRVRVIIRCLVMWGSFFILVIICYLVMVVFIDFFFVLYLFVGFIYK